ncbi:hypothetical protein HNQ36_003201 [Afipia massiliensis]|uniref:YdhG-like domain-containing protein n=1 Tax=Afipia massiliensis TaxID=211460 RepID=A0A840N2B0_9BRAD|nr:hypothetical protein [Afipia massiliensis]
MKRASEHRAFTDRNVAKVFDAYPDAVRAKLLTLRAMILETATKLDGVGPLEETLKWGQPSYLTAQSGTGSTIRIDRVKPADDRVAMYFHCQTDLVATFRELYPAQMEYGGNRSILFETTAKIPEKALRHCIGLALTYHARKGVTKNKSVSAKKTVSVKKTVSKHKREPATPKRPALRTRRARLS